MAVIIGFFTAFSIGLFSDLTGKNAGTFMAGGRVWLLLPVTLSLALLLLSGDSDDPGAVRAFSDRAIFWLVSGLPQVLASEVIGLFVGYAVRPVAQIIRQVSEL